MEKDRELELENITKDQAINELRKFFRGNKKFLNFAEVILATTFTDQDELISISLRDNRDNWNWEKIFRFTITYKDGFKTILYRKGNKKYAPSNIRNPDLKGNTTSNIHEFCIHNYANGKCEDYTIPA